ncbi:MAG: signal recognition particle-docking protein FtsY [Lactobacillaceae bacterium]|jgi:fused signal recognition particle receptor|nr:signal recognition particle-docking protein FtsY [Lactobacillaceae bacterium]
MISFFKKKKDDEISVDINPEKKMGVIKSIFTQKKLDEQTLEDLEDLLIMSDMGLKAANKIIMNFSKRRVDKKSTDDEIRKELAIDIEKILTPCEKPFKIDQTQKPYVVLMIGVNGAGKTTTIGKIAAKLKSQGLKVSLIAADTFRAAAVEQLEVWGQRNDIRVFHGDNGCNSAGLTYDGINEAIKQKDDVVLIDTAGRLQNKTHLMEELKKIVKVIKKTLPDAPNSTLLTLDATTGQNALEQVKVFKEAMDITGLIVTKLDGSSKGGVLIAIAEETKTPIHFIGLGEGIEHLTNFSAKIYAEKLVGF